MSDAQIEKLVLYRLSLPLTQPYKLAFGLVESFDTLLAEVVLADGATGWGEATVLTGYTEETISGAWSTATQLAEGLPGLASGAAMDAAMAYHHAAPFTTTALVTALEMARDHPVLIGRSRDGGIVEDERRAPLLAIVNAMDREGIRDEIEARLVDGYKTLKVKVGFDLHPDMDRLAFIQGLVNGRAEIRVDANQGYTQADAIEFMSGIDPSGIELVEQPCGAVDWPAAVAVAKVAQARGIPFMLDESIYGPDDVDRAAELNCADVIKLKLMKAGGLDALKAGLEHIRLRGMRPVLGNGVAGDIGCWMEACIAADMLDNAGEMNGFLKPKTQLFDLPMNLDACDLVLTPGVVTPDRDAITAHALETREFA